MFKDKSVPDGGAYTIDFSPVNQTSPMTLVKMLLGQSVLGTNTSTVCNYYLETDFRYFSLSIFHQRWKGEVRTRYIPGLNPNHNISIFSLIRKNVP